MKTPHASHGILELNYKSVVCEKADLARTFFRFIFGKFFEFWIFFSVNISEFFFEKIFVNLVSLSDFWKDIFCVK